MRQFDYSADADQHLVGIAEYSERHFGHEQTVRYMVSIESALARAVERPSLMRPRTDLGPGISAVRCTSHMAFLTQKDGRWLVIAVLHQRMDAVRYFRALRDD